MTLTWNSQYATSANLSGPRSSGRVNLSGSQAVGGGAGTYTLTVSGQGGSGSCQTTVQYQQPQQQMTCAQIGEYGTYPNCYTQHTSNYCPSGTFGTYPNCYSVVSQPAPAYPTPTTPVVINNNNNNNNVVYPAQPQPIIQYTGGSNLACSIDASRTSIRNGESTNLAWASNGAVSAVLTGMGTVSTTGSMSVHPSTSMNYVLTIYDQYGNTSTCNVNINVNGYNNPSISLSQIPYTGFDFGTFGNMVYWFALALFAVSLAYLAVYMQGGVWKLATRSVKGYTPVKPVTFVAPVKTPAHTTVAAVSKAPIKHGDAISMETVGGKPRLVISRN